MGASELLKADAQVHTIYGPKGPPSFHDTAISINHREAIFRIGHPLLLVLGIDMKYPWQDFDFRRLVLGLFQVERVKPVPTANIHLCACWPTCWCCSIAPVYPVVPVLLGAFFEGGFSFLGQLG
jgi:hypothetical protein